MTSGRGSGRGARHSAELVVWVLPWGSSAETFPPRTGTSIASSGNTHRQRKPLAFQICLIRVLSLPVAAHHVDRGRGSAADAVKKLADFGAQPLALMPLMHRSCSGPLRVGVPSPASVCTTQHRYELRQDRELERCSVCTVAHMLVCSFWGCGKLRLGRHFKRLFRHEWTDRRPGSRHAKYRVWSMDKLFVVREVALLAAAASPAASWGADAAAPPRKTQISGWLRQRYPMPPPVIPGCRVIPVITEVHRHYLHRSPKAKLSCFIRRQCELAGVARGREGLEGLEGLEGTRYSALEGLDVPKPMAELKLVVGEMGIWKTTSARTFHGPRVGSETTRPLPKEA